MFRSGSDRVEYNRIGPSRGHKIYFFRVWSGSGQDITGHYRVGVPKTLPRRTLLENSIESKVQEAIEDYRERKARKCNVIIHIIPESNKDDSNERKIEDTKSIN